LARGLRTSALRNHTLLVLALPEASKLAAVSPSR
jgi:hypothetical protein